MTAAVERWLRDPRGGGREGAVEPLRWFVRGEVVVAEVLVTRAPRDPEREAPRLARRRAVLCEIRDQSVGEVRWFDHIDEAHRVTGTDRTHEQPGPRG